jgi:O-acetylserine/cysteine efflux transporter
VKRDIGWRDGLLIAIVCVAWAGNFVFSKVALREFPPLIYTALRLMLLSAVLAPFMKRPPRSQWRRLAAVGLSNGVLHFGLAFWALKQSTTVASPTFALQSYVPISALLARVLRNEPVGAGTVIAIALSFSGVLVLGFDPSVLATPGTLGLVLVSAFFLALGTVLMRGLSGVDAVSQQGWTAAIGVLPLLAWSAAVEPGALEAVRHASPIAWGGVVYAALVVSLLGHGLFYVLVQRHPVARVTPYLLVSPVLTVVLGVVLLGDHLGPRLLIGGAMVLSGVLLISLSKWRAAS